MHRKEAVTYPVLLQIDTGGIQEFIFESNRLRDIRGASALLGEVNREMVPEIVRGYQGAHIIRSSGGVSIIGLNSKQDAEQLQREIDRLYARFIPGAALYSGVVESNSDDTVAALLSRLSYKTSITQGSKPRRDFLVTAVSPMVQFCQSCGNRPVEHQSKIIDERQLICRVCYTKRMYGTRARSGDAKHGPLGRFIHSDILKQTWGSKVNNWEAIIPEDFSAIGAASNGEIAMILADGNRLGQLLRSITDFATYKKFSKELADAVEAAVFETLCLYPAESTKAGGHALPWELVFLGGDDVLLITAANIAMDVAILLMQKVEEKTAELLKSIKLQDTDRKHIDMGAGVVIAPSHFPLVTLFGLAQSLEKSAKRKAYAQKDAPCSTIDFHRLTSDGNPELEQVRKWGLKPKRLPSYAYPAKIPGENEPSEYLGCRGKTEARPEDRIELVGRPYTIKECQEVLELARTWRNAGLPNNKIHLLYEALLESPAVAMYSWAKVVGRARDNEAKTWRLLEDVLCSDDQKVRTDRLPWVDSTGEENTSVAVPLISKTYLLDVIDLWSLLKKNKAPSNG